MRPKDPDEYKARYTYVVNTITRGKGDIMPHWGQSEGGPLLDEQINELTLMILNGDRQVPFEGKTATPWEHIADVVNDHVAQGLATLPKQPDVDLRVHLRRPLES